MIENLATIVWHFIERNARMVKLLTIFANGKCENWRLAFLTMRSMRTRLPKLCILLISSTVLASAAEVQGVIIDRKCAQDILKNGRQIVVKQRRDCSLRKNYVRDGYAIITDDKQYLNFDEAGNKKVIELLRNTPDKDNLKVVVTGNISGDTIAVMDMSML